MSRCQVRIEACTEHVQTINQLIVLAHLWNTHISSVKWDIAVISCL